jgi:hypothetical protein
MFIPGICLAGEPIATSAPEAPKPVLSWETGVGKSYLIPALEIPAFLLLLSGYDRLAYPNDMENGKKTYSSTLSTTWDHIVTEHWVVDQDPFAINQLGHPYQGTPTIQFRYEEAVNCWTRLSHR